MLVTSRERVTFFIVPMSTASGAAGGEGEGNGERENGSQEQE